LSHGDAVSCSFQDPQNRAPGCGERVVEEQPTA
jgi:hypothetical protein